MRYTIEDWENEVEVPDWLYSKIERESDGEMLDDNGWDYVMDHLAWYFDKTARPIFEDENDEESWVGVPDMDEDPDLGVSDDNWACGTLEVD